VWIVNENRFPRRLVGTPVSAFTWSPDGSRLLLRSPSGAWADTALDGSARQLPMHGSWADYLAPGLGYAFLDQGSLQVLRPDGVVVPIANGVSEAAVAPGGGRLAFVVRASAGDDRAYEIDGYDVELRSRYPYQHEPDRIDGLAWAPDGQALAYRVDPGDATHRQIKVRSLKDGSLVKVTTGQVSAPSWQADRQHVFFTAVADTAQGPLTKAFRLPIADAGPKGLGAAPAMPTGTGVEVSSLSPSADGHQLAFVSAESGRPGVWLMNADGTGLTQLTDADFGQLPVGVQSIAWTPT
jgi:Tol biopolymer transport system component